jgi:phosphatidylinositol alpha-1,6-mannosyltransferase
VVSEVFPPVIGGSGELLHNVYRRFSGTPVTVLCAAAPGTPTSSADAGMRVIRAPLYSNRWGVMHPAGLAHQLRWAARILRAGGRPPAVVHCCRILPEGLQARLARFAGGAPYVCWAHGEEIAGAGMSRELTWLLGIVQRSSAGLIANCQNTARLLEAFGVDPARIEVVYPGVDSTRFRPDAPGAADLRRRLAGDDDLLLLTVGRLQRRKGHDLVLRALAALTRRALSVRYVVVGDGDDHARLQQLADELGVSALVHFAGAVTSEMLPAYYAAADVFVHPNRVEAGDFEGFGIVFLEAAAAGLPVIAGASGGVPEAVVQDRTGMLVSGTSAEELEQAIAELAAHPARRRQLGEAGRQRVRTDFSWERAAAQVTAIHERVSAPRADWSRKSATGEVLPQ